jgi:hypothetical protein
MSTVKKPKVTKAKKTAKPKNLVTFHDSYETNFLGDINRMTAKLTPNGVECMTNGKPFNVTLGQMAMLEEMTAEHLKMGIISNSIYGNEIVAYVGEDGLCHQYEAK